MPQNTEDIPIEANDISIIPESGSRPRKRRRVLACETCRRIKSRCDFDIAAGSCNRCKTLRIPCSLTGSEVVGNLPRDAGINHPQTEISLIRELHAKISEQSVLLKDLKRIVEGQHNLPSPKTILHESNVASSTQNGDQDSTQSPADQNTESAPVVIIRNTLRKAHGGYERLTYHGVQGLVDCGFFSYSVIIDLLNIFLTRIAPWVQATSWEAMDINPDIDSMSTLLVAVCCLQGLRLSQLRNTQVHADLYEHVRRELATIHLISPLPMDCLHALSYMTLWNMAPLAISIRPEFIDSWLISGHCVQQGMLAINFTEILANVKTGRTNVKNQHELRLWNNICLAHLCFAVGTGRPSIIAEAYLDQCSSILNIFDASIQDGIVLAEIHLYSTLLKVLAASRPMPMSGKSKELMQWHEKWGHLLDLKTGRALMFRMSYHFGYLVISQRSLKNLTSGSLNSTAPTPVDHTTPKSPTTFDTERGRYISFSIEHATKMLETIIRLSPTTAEDMPDHLVLFYVFAVITLTTYYDDSPDKDATMKLLHEALKFCRAANVLTCAPSEFAVAKLERRLNEQVAVTESAKQSEQHQGHVFDDLLPAYSTVSFSDMEFPSLEDLFGGAFMTGAIEEDFLRI